MMVLVVVELIFFFFFCLFHCPDLAKQKVGKLLSVAHFLEIELVCEILNLRTTVLEDQMTLVPFSIVSVENSILSEAGREVWNVYHNSCLFL